MKVLTNKKGKFKLAGGGRIPDTYEHETDIMQFIKIARHIILLLIHGILLKKL